MKAQSVSSWQGKSAEAWRREWRAGEVRFFECVGSTNDVVAQLAAAGAPQLSLAVAEEQTRGRGRGGAAWQAERGKALLFSVLFRAAQPGGSPGCAPVRVGLAVAEAISAMCGDDALVKWPNDVVFPGKGKVAGVLCEGAFAAEGQAHIIAGVGINVL
ncbi:MAG TPA: biotin--[acetyl-CoA-carboxylase] ligase, partial [Longimicrobiales bacterium]